MLLKPELFFDALLIPCAAAARVWFTNRRANAARLAPFDLEAIAGETGAHHRQYLGEREAVTKALAGDPAFESIEIHEYSGGGIWLTGDVLKPEDRERLRERVERAIGATRAKEALGSLGH
jgi:hypothetical protein